MNDQELRQYCFTKSMEIITLYSRFIPMPRVNPIELSEMIFNYLRAGEVSDLAMFWRRERHAQ